MSYEYNYAIGENKNIIYIFEMKITYNNETIKKRLVTDLNNGELLQVKNDIKKIKISLCILNSNKLLNKLSNNTIIIIKNNNNNRYINNNLIITLNNNNDIIYVNYIIT